MPLTLSSKALTPLTAQCLFRSDERVAVHDHVARELADHSLRWRRGAPDAVMHKGRTEHLHVYMLKYGAEVEVTPHPFDDFCLVHTSLVGGLEIETDGQRLYIAEGRSAVLPARQSMRLHWQPGTAQLIVRVPHALLREVTGMQPDQAVDIGPGQVLPREHTALWDLHTEALLGAMSLTADTPMRAAWLTHFERSVAMFVAAQARTAQGSGQPTEAPVPVDHGTVAGGSRQAQRIDAVMHYIDSHIGAPISLEDLARAGNMSVRTLHQLCAQVHDLSPMAWVRERRLQAARRYLRLHPQATVTDTALRFGFAHAGRFASYYKARFGEMPSQTQARA